jgi:histidine ammonia-lyase
MLLDELIMGLNELGHMSFLRSERMLNRHLGKNNISKNHHFEYLHILLKKYSYFVAENKVLAIPGSIDTVLMQDYKHDLYVHEGTAHARLTALLKNLKYLCKLELMAAL